MRRLILTCLVFLIPLVIATPASAVLTHSFEGSFTGADAPEGPFFLITGVAVDASGGAGSGDVYVGGWSSGYDSVVDKFDASDSYAGVQITGVETPQGSFGLFSPSTRSNSGIAVDGSGSANRGDVYVADIEHDVIDRFSEAGTFICQITGRKPETVEEEEKEEKFGCAGSKGSPTPNESFVPGGLAVGAGGDLYVADKEHDVIDEFGPEGKYVKQIGGPELALSYAAPIALDSSGNLYVTNVGSDVVEFNAAGSFVSVLDSEKPSGVAVDPATGRVDVYETTGGQIAEYEAATGALLGRFGKGDFKGGAFVYGLAVGPTGKVYAGEFSGPPAVNIFGPDIVVPAVTTGKATDVRQTTATLHGEVEPDAAHGGETTECEFEYVTEKQFQEHPADPYEGAATAGCEPPASTPYKAPTDVSANITLAPSTTYHFRLRAANANAVPNYGSDETLTTYGPPAIDAESATELTISEMTLQARIDPFGYDSTCELQYVDEGEFESSGYATATTLPCAPADLGSGFGDQGAGATLSGLALDTTYHYRFVATNQAGTMPGADQTFATFGLQSFSFGLSSTQAGAHPEDMTDSFSFNTSTDLYGNHTAADANPKEVQTELPPGLIGNPDAMPKCSPHDVAHGECANAAQIGVMVIETGRAQRYEGPLYNVVPPAGVAAQFGAHFAKYASQYIDAKVRTGGDYGVTADAGGNSAAEGIRTVSVTLWGVPGDPSHDDQREPCISGKSGGGSCTSEAPAKPFLTNPTSCSGPLKTTMRVDSWQAPESFAQAVSEMAGITGCERLHFTPTIEVTPESTSSDSPTGLSVNLHVPQNEDPAGLAEADLRDAVVTLPEGVTVNPSAAYGRQGCTLLKGTEAAKEEREEKGEEVGIDLESKQPANCPDSSKIGSVLIETPLLEHPLQGGVYLAQQGNAGPVQGANPFGSLLAIYIAAENAERGVVVKLAGHVEVNEKTGQLSTTFDEDPQLPFENLKLDFFGGARAPLATPQVCGSYQTTSLLEPWSTLPGGTSSSPAAGEASGTPDATPFSTFQIGSGPGGSPCAARGFAPAFTAGTANNQAGAFSPFTLELSRQDGEQTLSTVGMTMPPGLLGMLSKVQLCEEPQAQAGACPASSQIGHVTATAGIGNEPLTLPEAGRGQDPVYLTGPYDGAPFGLSIVVPAEAGPFNLGTVVVRARIEVDPHTAQVSVLSDPLPQMLQGVPVDVRTVDVVIDRSEFTFNPTDCLPSSVGGTIGSAEGAVASVSSRFEAANCATLPFKPSFTATTQGKASKAEGASLTVKIASKGGPGVSGEEANIRAVKVDLPKQLPSRLSTLQKACTEARFNANPAGCPKESDVGTATAKTPVLAGGGGGSGGNLIGPAYLVSHGDEAFPDLEIVLQGEGITLVLDGNTLIKQGITSSTFKTVPDAPISSFELKLGTGKYSILGTDLPASAKYSLCGQTLSMPTAITAQNGTEIHESTPIGVTGCKKVVKKALTRAQKLKAALKVCRTKDKGKTKAKRRKREVCEKLAHKRYGPVKHKHKKQKQK